MAQGAGTVASVRKAAAILRSFTPFAPVLSVRDLAQVCEIPRSTVHALCTSLANAGLLEPANGGGYRLGPELIVLGAQVLDRRGLVAAADGVLSTLAETTGAEVHLGQLVEGWIVYLERIPRSGGVLMRNRTGLRAPAHSAGCGKAALAFVPADRLEVLLAGYLAEGVSATELQALREELALAAQRRYVINRSFQPGRTSVAAPVLDADGVGVGGLSVAASDTQVARGVPTAWVREVCGAADVVSRRLVTSRQRETTSSGRGQLPARSAIPG